MDAPRANRIIRCARAMRNFIDRNRSGDLNEALVDSVYQD
jgi:hypothetical protein